MNRDDLLYFGTPCPRRAVAMAAANIAANVGGGAGDARALAAGSFEGSQQSGAPLGVAVAGASVITPATGYRGLRSADAAARLSVALRAVLADDARRIALEAARDRGEVLRRQLGARHHALLLAAAAALLAAYAYGVDASAPAADTSLLVAAIAVVAGVALNVGLVFARLHRLRWEVHDRMADALLEFERSALSGSTLVAAAAAAAASTAAAAATAAAATTATAAEAVRAAAAAATAGALVSPSGIVAGFRPQLWEALEFHESSLSTHALPVFRDGEWVRLPVCLLVRGDLIALTNRENSPAKFDDRDGRVPGRRGSVLREYLQLPVEVAASAVAATAAAAGSTATGPSSATVAVTAALTPAPAPAGTASTAAEAVVAVAGASSAGADAGASTGVAAGAHAAAAAFSSPATQTAGVAQPGPPKRPLHAFASGGSTSAPAVAVVSGAAPAAAAPLLGTAAVKLRENDIDALTLVGDLRRCVLKETVARAALQRRLRAHPKPQPLLAGQLRSFGRLFELAQLWLVALAAVAVIVRSLLTDVVPDAGGGGGGGAQRAPTNVGRGGFIGLIAGLLSQLPALLLAASPLALPAFLLLTEALGTARLLAVHEAVLLRSRWKDWKKRLVSAPPEAAAVMSQCQPIPS